MPRGKEVRLLSSTETSPVDRKIRNVVPPQNEDEDSNEAEVVLSNKGGPKIIHKHFMYTLHKKQPYNIRWRCVGRSYFCRGSLVTTVDCKRPRVHMEHNHEPDYFAATAARRRYLDLGKPPIVELEEYNAQQTNNTDPVEFVNVQDELFEVEEKKIEVSPENDVSTLDWGPHQ